MGNVMWRSPISRHCASLVAQTVKSLPAVRDTQVWYHGNPRQYSCLENPHGQRSVVGYSLWCCKESDTTKQLSTHKGVPRLTIMCIFFPPLFPTISTNKTAVYNESSLKFYQFRSFSNWRFVIWPLIRYLNSDSKRCKRYSHKRVRIPAS